MGHRITIVDDDVMPDGHDFVFIRHSAGAHIFYRRSTLDEGPLEDSWAAYRALMWRQPPRSPITREDFCAEVLDLFARTG